MRLRRSIGEFSVEWLLCLIRWLCSPEIAAGYGDSAVDPKFLPRRGVMGVLLVVCVARQYASRYSAKCSQASSSWFSSKITSNISGGHCASLSAATNWTFKCLLCDFPLDLISRCKTFGEDTLTWTIIGARDVLISCAGWLIVSASRTTSCKDRASSKILSISLCTSAKLDRVFDRSIIALLLGLFRTDLLAREMSAVTRVIDILVAFQRRPH